MLCTPQVTDKRLTSHMQCNGFPRNAGNHFSEGQLVHRPVYVFPENRVSKFTTLPLGRSSDWTSESAATEGFELLSPQPTIVYWLGQPNEKSMQDQDISFKPLPGGGSTLGHRKKVKNSLTMCPTCHMVANSSSGLDSAPLTSESAILHDDDDKPPKRSSKKRRNKWKQLRQATHENTNLLPEILLEEQIDVASPVEVPLPDLLADKLSDTSSSAAHLGKDDHAEDVTDSSSHTERVQCSSEACSSKVFHPVSSGRSGRRSRETSSCNNSTATNRVVGANRQKRSGKDGAVSVWQKVEKLDKEKSSGAGHVVVPAADDTNKGVQHDPSRPMDKHRCKKSCKQHSPDVAAEMGLTTENGALYPCQKISRCVCKKQTPFLYEQTSLSCKMGSCQSSKNYYAPKNGIPKMPKNHSQPIEGLSMLQLVCASGITDRPTATDIEKATLPSHNLDSQLVPQSMSKEACTLVIQDDTHSLCLENKAISSDLDSRNLCADPCAAEMEETKGVESYSISVKKDITHCSAPEAYVVEASVPADTSVSANIDVKCNFSDVPASTKSEGRKGATEVTAKLNSSGQPDSRCQGHIQTGTFFTKIREAVSDAYRVQQRAEDIKLLTGRPLADFEQFIYSASPALHCTSCPTGCNSSSQERVRDRFCFHQTAGISLSSIWQWYEEPGCYGLEVKAQDLRRSKGFWNSHCQFNAYFVPYLSAVQLFGQSERTIDKDAVDTGAKSNTSPCLSSLPILAKLLPKESNQRNSPSALHIKHDQQSEAIEPVFEFFESEQPFWRRQLFDKVKELIGGTKQSNCRISGDPKNLELNLHDLHPASWYCVAWYPIYRIPDGKFQAAFLTYHSLGHWVHRRSLSDLAGHSHAVLPVVGLQSYNDKGEWWFQTSSSGGLEGAAELAGSSPDDPPSQVLSERVLTLKQAAAAMARADVPSKNQARSRNRHPDYEFFLSRQR